MSSPEEIERSLTPELLRGVLGGTLMGLANLVPGISGGTMLLAAGVYPRFVGGIAELTTFTFRPRSMALLASIIGAAAVSIVLFAGLLKGLVVDHRWAMFSIFIGLTLGGVPVVWKLIRPATTRVWVGVAIGMAVMIWMALAQPAGTGGGERSYSLLLASGVAGASAMILPGISGGYLLLVLGQYLTILGAIDQAKSAVLNSAGPQWGQIFDAFHVVIPVGLGVVIGVVAVSNAIRYLLAHHRGLTLGLLLGLLLGAVFGLWPFQMGVAPQPGDVVKGRVMTPTLIADLDAEDYPLQRFDPTTGQIAASLALIVAGFAVTQGVARVGGGDESQSI
jgi:putative membrane protein